MMRIGWMTLVLAACVAWSAESGMAQTDKPADAPAEMRTVAKDFVKAMETKNSTRVQRILADTYVGVDLFGHTVDRAGRLKMLEQTDFKLTEAKSSDQVVAMVGQNMVVSGLYDVKGSINGHDVTGQYRYVDVWAKIGDDWKVIASTMTRVVDEAQK
jgi:ketosteroid isomerase-like protein